MCRFDQRPGKIKRPDSDTVAVRLSWRDQKNARIASGREERSKYHKECGRLIEVSDNVGQNSDHPRSVHFKVSSNYRLIASLFEYAWVSCCMAFFMRR